MYRRILGIPWGFLIGAELTIVQSRISLVNKIQKVYRSQGVQIHSRHIEIIARQITSEVLVSEDGMSNVFSPGELIGLLRAERAMRALEEAICYRTVFLGITRAYPSTQSFISEASFQETARVLAKAVLRSRIDWLKGLKENVVLGGMIPVGTGLFSSGYLFFSLKNKRDRVWRGMIRRYWNINLKEILETGVHSGHALLEMRLQKFRDLRMEQKTGGGIKIISCNVLSYSINILKGLYEISGVEVGQHSCGK